MMPVPESIAELIHDASPTLCIVLAKVRPMRSLIWFSCFGSSAKEIHLGDIRQHPDMEPERVEAVVLNPRVADLDAVRWSRLSQDAPHLRVEGAGAGDDVGIYRQHHQRAIH